MKGTFKIAIERAKLVQQTKIDLEKNIILLFT